MTQSTIEKHETETKVQRAILDQEIAGPSRSPRLRMIGREYRHHSRPKSATGSRLSGTGRCVKSVRDGGPFVISGAWT